MSDTTITERQRFWLEHLRAAEASADSLAAYARGAGLRPKELYQWKTVLGRRGLLAGTAGPVPDGGPRSGFVRVVAPVSAPGLRLLLPNGVRLECPADIGRETLAALVETASRL